MYASEIIWWGYTAFEIAVGLFMAYFVWKVTQKKGG